jgi:alanine-synthesizing transaminase
VWHFNFSTKHFAAKQLLAQANVFVSHGFGFGAYGDGHVRFALIENEGQIRQAIRGIKSMGRRYET